MQDYYELQPIDLHPYHDLTLLFWLGGDPTSINSQTKISYYDNFFVFMLGAKLVFACNELLELPTSY